MTKITRNRIKMDSYSKNHTEGEKKDEKKNSQPLPAMGDVLLAVRL
jgi:hypothetical protein